MLTTFVYKEFVLMTSNEPTELEIHPLFQSIFLETSSRISRVTEDEGSCRFFASLLTGGYIAANALINLCQGVKKYWGEGDREKALALTRLTTLLMLSQTFRWLEEQNKAKGEPPRTNSGVVSTILSLFGDSSEEAIKYFFDLDTQFKYEIEHHTELTHLKVYLLARACEACGHKCLDWNKVSLPIKSLEPLTSSGTFLDSATLGDINNIWALWLCHSIGLQAMTKYHEEQSKS
jgi:hypothetical protein